MTLTIGAMPNGQWHHLVPLLKCLGWQPPQTSDPERWYQDEQVAANPPVGHHYLLLYTRPEVVIAQAMYKGQDPIAVLQYWQTTALCLLDFYKRNAHCSVLVEIVNALKHPQNCLEGISSHLNLSVESPVPNLNIPVEIPAQYQLLANQLVAQTPALEDTLSQLKVNSLSLSDDIFAAPSLDIAHLYEQLLAQRRIEEQSNAALKAAKEENELILWQLHQVQEELENVYLQRNQKKEIAKAKKQIEKVLRIANTLQEKLLIKMRKNSIVWKASAPFRALTRPIRRVLSKKSDLFY